ncbi:MAG: DUF1761 domain-containing protein [Bacteroidia bacterium]
MIASLNYVHILVSALVYFILGALWYSLLFQKPWMAAVGVREPNEADKKGMPLMFATTFVLNFVICFGTAAVLHFVQPISIVAALKAGALLGVCFVGTTCAMNNMYAKRPLILTLIDSGYHVAGIIVVSVILTLWH